MILRKCRDCSLEATTEEALEKFVFRKENKFGRRNICKRCYQIRTNEDGKRRFRKNKKKAIEYKGGECIRCGVTSADVIDAVFDFHHTDPNKKELHIGKIMHHSWEKIREELDKCVLLCANCHRTVHNEEIV